MNLPKNPLESTTLQRLPPQTFHDYVKNMHRDVSSLINLTRSRELKAIVTTLDLDQFTYGLENLQRNIARLLESVKATRLEKENDG